MLLHENKYCCNLINQIHVYSVDVVGILTCTLVENVGILKFPVEM